MKWGAVHLRGDRQGTRYRLGWPSSAPQDRPPTANPNKPLRARAVLKPYSVPYSILSLTAAVSRGSSLLDAITVTNSLENPFFGAV